MKKLIAIILTLMLGFSLGGCGGGQQTDDLAKQSGQPTIDIRDMDGLYDFVNAEVYQMSREDFDMGFKIFFMDVTGNGNEDAVMFNDLDWSTNIEIVIVNGDQYKIIKTDLQVQKYKNEFEMQDGFLKVLQASGGTGIYWEVMSLLKYDNGRMVTVLEYLEIESRESPVAEWYSEHTAQITGTLSNFDYVLTKDDNGEKSVERWHYTYNKDTLSFDEKNIDDAEQNTQHSESVNTSDV
ncbi:MAG: hypothetical protein U9N81_00455 [Bacillota bacterium]|nr:hypothetical protein [Bacillota bacterium]